MSTQKTIAQLWNGNLQPIVRSGINNRQIKELEELMRRNIEELEEGLTDQQKEVFSVYSDCIEEYLVLTNEQSFCDGYSLGTKLTVEALTGAELFLQY